MDEAAAVFSGAPFRWWIAEGHALELHTGRSWRDHDDLDVGVCRDQSEDLFAWLSGWILCVAAEDALGSWDGSPLDARTNQNNVWARRRPNIWLMDLTVGDGDEDVWVYRRDRSVTRPWPEGVLHTSGGVPYLAPDLQLLFKSKDRRRKDDIDAAQVISGLTTAEWQFLSIHLATNHPWRELR